VLGNVLVGSFFGHRRGWPSGIRFDQKALDRATEALTFVDLLDEAGTDASLLSAFDRKRLMLATAIATAPSLLMLDEPAAGLSSEEEEQLVGLIESVQRSGTTIMIIEHVMSVLTRVSDRVMAMHEGAKLFEGTPGEFREHPEVMRVYLGAQEGASLASATAEGGSPDA
jgi:branched-chain amino acid transport system ATP-binding protein